MVVCQVSLYVLEVMHLPGEDDARIFFVFIVLSIFQKTVRLSSKSLSALPHMSYRCLRRTQHRRNKRAHAQNNHSNGCLGEM